MPQTALEMKKLLKSKKRVRPIDEDEMKRKEDLAKIDQIYRLAASLPVSQNDKRRELVRVAKKKENRMYS